MPNMSYCRFNNTKLDLYDCLNALNADENEYEISKTEVKAGKGMFKSFLDFCVEAGIIQEYDEDRIGAVFEEHNAAVRANQEEMMADEELIHAVNALLEKEGADDD